MDDKKNLGIDKLKSILNNKTFANGVALPCHYLCNISPGFGLFQSNIFSKTLGPLGNLLGNSLINKSSQQVSFLAESLSLPGRSFLTSEQKLYGVLRKMPYGVQYEDIDITFICTNSMIERNFFNVWHQYIMDTESQYMHYYQDYVGRITIQKINNNDSKSDILSDLTSNVIDMLNTYTLHDAYPISIQSQNLSYVDGDEYLKLTVTFTYSKWTCGVDDISSIVGNNL